MKIAFAIYASHYLIFQQKPQPQCQTAVPDCAARTANSQPQSHKPDREARLHSQNREATPRSNTAKPHCTVKTANSTAKPQPRPRSRLHCQDHDLATAKTELQIQAAKHNCNATTATSN